MSRYGRGGSHTHRIETLIQGGCYRLHWVVDRYYANNRLRWPQHCSRDTDLAGARRFSKKWHCPVDCGCRSAVHLCSLGQS